MIAIISKPIRRLSNFAQKFLGIHFIVHKLNAVERRLSNLESTADAIVYEKAVSRIPPQMFQNHHHYCRPKEVLRLLKTSNLANHKLSRIGSLNDGGYVMVDDFDACKNKIAYSIGIGLNVDWDLAVSEKGYSVYMYDHTIDKLPQDNSHFFFNKRGLGSRRDPSPHTITLGQMLAENKHEMSSEMLLKLDIEGAEWNILPELKDSELCQFDQITLELHDLTRILNDEHFYISVIESLEALNRHHSCIHVHINSACPLIIYPDFLFPSTIEVTFALRSKYPTEELEMVDVCPLVIDSPTFAHKIDFPIVYS